MRTNPTITVAASIAAGVGRPEGEALGPAALEGVHGEPVVELRGQRPAEQQQHCQPALPPPAPALVHPRPRGGWSGAGRADQRDARPRQQRAQPGAAQLAARKCVCTGVDAGGEAGRGEQGQCGVVEEDVRIELQHQRLPWNVGTCHY